MIIINIIIIIVINHQYYVKFISYKLDSSLPTPGPTQEYFMINEFQNTWQEVVEAYFEVWTRFSVEELVKLRKS